MVRVGDVIDAVFVLSTSQAVLEIDTTGDVESSGEASAFRSRGVPQKSTNCAAIRQQPSRQFTRNGRRIGGIREMDVAVILIERSRQEEVAASQFRHRGPARNVVLQQPVGNPRIAWVGANPITRILLDPVVLADPPMIQRRLDVRRRRNLRGIGTNIQLEVFQRLRVAVKANASADCADRLQRSRICRIDD